MGTRRNNVFQTPQPRNANYRLHPRERLRARPSRPQRGQPQRREYVRIRMFELEIRFDSLSRFARLSGMMCIESGHAEAKCAPFLVLSTVIHRYPPLSSVIPETLAKAHANDAERDRIACSPASAQPPRHGPGAGGFSPGLRLTPPTLRDCFPRY